MKKALEKIKEIIDFCDAVGCHRAIYESIKFVEKELEEAQLTRREWYQKGYAEAMKQRTCEWCKYFRNEDKGCFESTQNTYIRPASIRFSGCGMYKPKDTQC